MLLIMEFFFDVGLLLSIRPFNNNIPETELRQITPEKRDASNVHYQHLLYDGHGF